MLNIRKKTLLYFLIPFLVMLFIGFIFLLLTFNTRYNARKNEIISNNTKTLELIRDKINFTLDNIVSDLIIIEELKPFKQFISTNTSTNRESVANMFKLLISERRVYDQIRFLDSNGMEIVRVNYNKGNPYIVPYSELQNKGNRYYFKETYKLKFGEVFYSPLDLNIEHNSIEIPEKPMIRIGTPVFDDKGEKKGIILLNFLADNIMDIISSNTNNSLGNFYLLNPDAYWLYSEDKDLRWGFMYNNRSDITFKNSNPVIWNKMLTMESGILSENDNVYLFATIFPLNSRIINFAVTDFSNDSNQPLKSQDYFWKIINFIPNEVFMGLGKEVLGNMKLLIILVVITTLIFSTVLSRLFFIQELSKEQMNNSLKEKDLLLREIHHRVKNSLTLVSSFISLYSYSLKNEETSHIFEELRQKIETISLVHTYLYQSTDIKFISLSSYLNTLLIKLIKDLSPGSVVISLKLDIEEIILTAKTVITLGIILSELAINSLKYAFTEAEKGTICITGRYKKENSQITIVYSDNGRGLPDDFNIQDSNSLGMVLIESLSKQLGGSLKITTGSNSSFKIEFPVPDMI